MVKSLQENKYDGDSIITTTILEIPLNIFDMVAESTDDRGVTEAALNSEYTTAWARGVVFFFFLAFNMLQNI